ncbi:catalase family protein [Sedimentitalea xiamensis]|nr:hypothetical protein [Sedimentitalea xiamensis]
MEKSSQTRSAWRKHQVELESMLARGERPSERDLERLAAYRHIFDDLPDRPDGACATRDVHRKTHGCYRARVTISEDLDPALAKGLFVPGREYDAVVRFSNGNPRNQSDSAPDARGMAIKLLESGTLPDGTALNTLSASDINAKGLLDILTINFPVFFVDDPLVYAKVNTHFLADDEDVLKSKKLDEVLAVAGAGMSLLEQNLALKVNGSIIRNLLYQQWFSMAPSRLGEAADAERTAVKYLIEPARATKGDPDWPEWSTWETGRNYQIPLSKRLNIPRQEREAMDANPDILRTRLEETLSQDDFEMDLKVQTFLSEEATPIEDTTRIWHWSEEEIDAWLGDALSLPFVSRRQEARRRDWHPPVRIATIRITGSGGMAGNSEFCEDLSFNPWNNVPAAHKPLGITQRVKRFAYAASRTARYGINRVQSTFPPVA